MFHMLVQKMSQYLNTDTLLYALSYASYIRESLVVEEIQTPATADYHIEPMPYIQ